MSATGESGHEEAWQLLPWLANGRLSQAERDRIEPHVHSCAACREELALQRVLCNALTEPDRVTYAPGPSFRKLMDRIDGATPQPRKTQETPDTRERKKAPAIPIRRRVDSHVSLWRPPGLAWAASFVLAIGLAGVGTTLYRSSQPLYMTHTDTTLSAPNVLHIAFDRTVTVGEAEEALRATGAHVVGGPDSTGIFGVTPGALTTGKATPERQTQEMRVLSARLRADPRVRWVEPIAGDDRAEPTSRGP